MRNLQYIIPAILCLALYSCSTVKKATQKNGTAFKTTKSGIKYKFLQDAKGDRYVQEGEYVEIFIKTFFNDSLIFDSKEQSGGLPVTFPAGKPQFNGDLSEAFYLMTPGDSAIFLVSVDSLKANKQAIQPWMQEGKDITYAMKLVNIKSKEQVIAEREAKNKPQPQADPAKDDAELLAYFSHNNIKAVKRPSGLYYVIHQTTDGEKPLSGRTVKVNYTGKLLNGTQFDSNAGRGAPFSFTLGRGQVILGWDEGIALLKKGEKATLYIPSRLAYGESSPTPKIPPGSILIFDVELVDF